MMKHKTPRQWQEDRRTAFWILLASGSCYMLCGSWEGPARAPLPSPLSARAGLYLVRPSPLVQKTPSPPGASCSSEVGPPIAPLGVLASLANECLKLLLGQPAKGGHCAGQGTCEHWSFHPSVLIPRVEYRQPSSCPRHAAPIYNQCMHAASGSSRALALSTGGYPLRLPYARLNFSNSAPCGAA